MKPDKNFKLSKSSKRILASMPLDKRSSFKKLMIQAELTETRAKNAKIKEKD